MENSYVSELQKLVVAAALAIRQLDDWASNNETMFTGWGDQVVPPDAEWWRVKTGQALRALGELPGFGDALKLPRPADEGEMPADGPDGFRAEDFKHVADAMLGNNEAVRRATMSNCFNVILAALDRAIAGSAVKEPGLALGFVRDEYGVDLATIKMDATGGLEVTRRGDGYSLTVHYQSEEKSHMDDLSVDLTDDHLRAIGALAAKGEPGTIALEALANRGGAEPDDEALTLAKDEGADFVLDSLAKALGLEQWTNSDGSESWDGDVHATLMHLLWDAGVLDRETNALANRGADKEAKPVDYQQREKRSGSPEWSRWYPSSKNAFEEWSQHKEPSGRYFFGPAEYEVRALYTNPSKAEPVRVRELEWQHLDREERADALGWQYRARDFGPAWDNPIQLTIDGFDQTQTKVLFFTEMAAAQATAQEHYSNAIRSALQQPDEGTTR